MSEPTSGYVHCAHRYCLAIIIGKPGELCEDCEKCDEDPQAISCEGCDHD